MKSSTFTDKLNKRLNYLSDHSKYVDAQKSEKSALVIEMIVVMILYSYKEMLRTGCLAMICLSCWHIFRMVYLIKRSPKDAENGSKKTIPPSEKDIKAHKNIAILHCVWIGLFVLVFIIR